VTLPSIPTTELTLAGTYGPYRTTATLLPGVQDAVYLAERADTGARVALRVFSEDAARDEDLVRALRDHAGRLAALSVRSSAIATVYECGVTPSGAVYLALEPPDGVTLAEALRRDGPFRPERAVRLAIGIAEPLEAAHMMGVVHGCLGPQNVSLVGGDETVKLTQFGFDWVRTMRWLSRRGARVVGAATTPYQAPEQALTGEATNQSDVFAVGALLYEMLTGRPPGTRLATRRRGGTLPLRKLRPEVTRSLDRIVMRALSPAASRRHRDMTDLFNDLWSEINPFSSAIRQEPVGGRRGRAGTVKWVALAAGVLVAAGSAVVLGTGWLGEQDADTLLLQRARTPAGVASPPPPAPPAPVAHTPVPVAPPPAAVALPPLAPPAPSPTPSAVRDVAPSPAAPIARVVTPRSALENAPRGTPVEAPRTPTGARIVTQPSTPAPESPVREAADDGGAIIDWLLKEGSPTRR
jgi:serine/threonine protein kinase